MWSGSEPSQAEDVVSLTFLEAWRVRESLRPDGESLRPWLLGIATNVLRNRRRAARRHREALRRLPPREAEPDFADDVVARMHDSDRLATAIAALRALRRMDREVFLLCVWSQLDYVATAEALGIPVGTVRSRLSRARTRLRALARQETPRPRRQPAGEDPQTARSPQSTAQAPPGTRQTPRDTAQTAPGIEQTPHGVDRTSLTATRPPEQSARTRMVAAEERVEYI